MKTATAEEKLKALKEKTATLKLKGSGFNGGEKICLC